jgi:hypothetical protein
VEKIPIYKEGAAGLKRLAQNLEELKSRGVPVLSCRLEDTKLVMPRIEAPRFLSI